MSEYGQSLRSLYQLGKTTRDHYLQRARDIALVTTPHLMLPEGWAEGSPLPTPYQSLGGRGVKVLTNKLLMVVMPPGQSFFKMELPKEGDDRTQGKRDKETAALEDGVVHRAETSGFRVVLHEAVRQLLISGNYLLHLDNRGGGRGYRLDKFCVWRSPSGKLLRIVIEDHRALWELEREALAIARMRGSAPVDVRGMAGVEATDPETRTVPVYTGVMWDEEKRKYRVWQEIGEDEIPESEAEYEPHELPFIHSRMVVVPGESYGRAYLDEVLGDLATYDGLVMHMLTAASILAKVLFLIRPGSTVRPQDLAKPSGSAAVGSPDDVTALQARAVGDLGFATTMAEDLKRRLQAAFLMNESATRDAERVTAEEIRFLALELEDALGGVYTSLSIELQRPYVLYQLVQMAQQEGGPELSRDLVKKIESGDIDLYIVTGLQALGRGHELQKLRGFLSDLAGIIGPEGVLEALRKPELVDRLSAAWGVESEGLVQTAEEIAQQGSRAQALQMMEQVIPQLNRPA